MALPQAEIQKLLIRMRDRDPNASAATPPPPSLPAQQQQQPQHRRDGSGPGQAPLQPLQVPQQQRVGAGVINTTPPAPHHVELSVDQQMQRPLLQKEQAHAGRQSQSESSAASDDFDESDEDDEPEETIDMSKLHSIMMSTNKKSKPLFPCLARTMKRVKGALFRPVYFAIVGLLVVGVISYYLKKPKNQWQENYLWNWCFALCASLAIYRGVRMFEDLFLWLLYFTVGPSTWGAYYYCTALKGSPGAIGAIYFFSSCVTDGIILHFTRPTANTPLNATAQAHAGLAPELMATGSFAQHSSPVLTKAGTTTDTTAVVTLPTGPYDTLSTFADQFLVMFVLYAAVKIIASHYCMSLRLERFSKQLRQLDKKENIMEGLFDAVFEKAAREGERKPAVSAAQYATVPLLRAGTVLPAAIETSAERRKQASAALARAKAVFSHLDSDGKGQISLSHLNQFLPKRKAIEVFLMLQPTLTGTSSWIVTRQRFLDAQKDLLLLRTRLMKSLTGFDSTSGIIRPVLHIGYWIVCLIFFALYYLHSSAAAAASVGSLLTFAFVFKTPCWLIFSSLLLVAYQQAFDAHDHVLIGGVPYTIEVIHLLSTIARTTSNQVVELPNAKLASQTIINLTQSSSATLITTFTVNALGEEASRISNLVQTQIGAHIFARSTYWFPGVDMRVTTVDTSDPEKLSTSFEVVARQRNTWSDSANVTRASSEFLSVLGQAVKNACEEVQEKRGKDKKKEKE